MMIPKDVVEGVQKFWFAVPLKIFEDPGYKVANYTILKQWAVAHQWLVKKLWDRKVKIAVSKPVKKALELRGDFLVQVFNLCERCHSFQSSLDFVIPYKNAGVWFNVVELEFIGLELETLIDKPEPINGNIKRGLIEVNSERLRQLKSWNNPYENTPAIGLDYLAKSAIKIASVSNQFDRTHWKPFLNTYAKMISDLKTNPIWGVGYIRDGKYFMQGGRGRGGETRLCFGDVTEAEIPALYTVAKNGF
jgi:hypothetical protein